MGKTTYTLSEASKILNLHPKTLQRLDRECVLIARRTSTNRRYYIKHDLDNFIQSKRLEIKMGLIDDILEAIRRYDARMESQQKMEPVQ